MSSRDIDLVTIEEWRELGFHYLLDEKNHFWLLRGSREGFRKFVDSLREYSQVPANAVIGEHDHLGPYSYLKITTGIGAEISDDGIAGTLDDLVRFASIVESYLDSPAQKKFVISKDFAPASLFEIRFEIEEANFDPSSVDSAIVHRS